MDVTHVKIVDRRIVLVFEDGHENSLEDGVYRSSDGSWITVRNSSIVDSSDRPDLDRANGEELGRYVTDLERQLSTIGDDAQLANIDLQNMLQKQQQTIQMLSSISKALHDTVLAVIRKIG